MGLTQDFTTLPYFDDVQVLFYLIQNMLDVGKFSLCRFLRNETTPWGCTYNAQWGYYKHLGHYFERLVNERFKFNKLGKCTPYASPYMRYYPLEILYITEAIWNQCITDYWRTFDNGYIIY